MNKIKLGTNFTVFLLFFGIAAIEAFRSRNWVNIVFWLSIGFVFLVADNFRKAK
jgi:phosphoglycerol transferase MdoB-like AlkP superfamily enzyme